MDRKQEIRDQIKSIENQIKHWQMLGVLTSATVFTIFLIFGFKNPLAYTFTLVPYVAASLAGIPLMVELNRLCSKLTGK